MSSIQNNDLKISKTLVYATLVHNAENSIKKNLVDPSPGYKIMQIDKINFRLICYIFSMG